MVSSRLSESAVLSLGSGADASGEKSGNTAGSGDHMQLRVLQRSLAQATQVHPLAATTGEHRAVVGRVLDLSGSVSDSSRLWPRSEKGRSIHLQDLW